MSEKEWSRTEKLLCAIVLILLAPIWVPIVLGLVVAAFAILSGIVSAIVDLQ